jgi:hypothetical protein
MAYSRTPPPLPHSVRETEIHEKIASVEGFLMQATVDKAESKNKRKFLDALTTLKSKFPGSVHGCVIDLCKPTLPRYDLPLSLLLGKHSDSLVVSTQAEALRMIAFMKAQKLPRATLLPLDTLVAPALNERGRGIPGCRLAVDVLTFEACYEPVMLYVCGNDMICDDLDGARNLVFERKLKVKGKAVVLWVGRCCVVCPCPSPSPPAAHLAGPTPPRHPHHSCHHGRDHHPQDGHDDGWHVRHLLAKAL